VKSSSLPARPSWIRSTALLLVAAIGLHALAPSALARPISSVEVLAGSTGAADLAKIQQALEHKVVNQRLIELGFTPAEIQLRLAQASDAELHQLATESEKLMAGGAAGLLISLLVIILLVFLILRVSDNGTLPAANGLRQDLMMA
jgi:hypothetical protein